MDSPRSLADFRTALERYQSARSDFLQIEEAIEPGQGIKRHHPDWIKADTARSVAAEGLWVSGMAGFFNLLEVNYKAQERLVAEQLKLAEKQVEYAKGNSESAAKVARWTKVLAIVTAVLILATILAGFSGFIAAR